MQFANLWTEYLPLFATIVLGFSKTYWSIYSGKFPQKIDSNPRENLNLSIFQHLFERTKLFPPLWHHFGILLRRKPSQTRIFRGRTSDVVISPSFPHPSSTNGKFSLTWLENLKNWRRNVFLTRLFKVSMAKWSDDNIYRANLKSDTVDLWVMTAIMRNSKR